MGEAGPDVSNDRIILLMNWKNNGNAEIMPERIKDFYHFLGVVLVCYFEIKQVHVMLSE